MINLNLPMRLFGGYFRARRDSFDAVAEDLIKARMNVTMEKWLATITFYALALTLLGRNPGAGRRRPALRVPARLAARFRGIQPVQPAAGVRAVRRRPCPSASWWCSSA